MLDRKKKKRKRLDILIKVIKENINFNARE